MKHTVDGIHALRGIAAIMVVVAHAKFSVPGSEAWPEFGSAGVDIFFVISGFVMAHSTRNIDFTPQAAGLFIRKRIVRIVPLYWLAILWTARRSPPDFNLLQDLLFLPHYNDQWPGMIAPIVQQGWTLNYEMFFYALFGVAILFGPKRLFVILSALVAIPFIGLIVSPENVVSKFYTHNIVLEFGFGVVLQHYLTRFPEWKRSAYLTLMGIGFVLIAIGHNQEPRALAQGLPALLIVWCSFKACEGALKLPFVGLLGEASYAIYLFHWSSFGVMKPVTRLIGPDQVALLMLGHVAVGIGAGLAIHLLLEKRLTALASRLLLSEGTSRPQLAAPAVP